MPAGQLTLRKGKFAINSADATSFADQFLRWQKWSAQFESRGAGPENDAV